MAGTVGTISSNRRVSAILSAGLALVVGVKIKASEADQLDFYNILGHQAIPGIPAGPFSAWSDSDRREGWKTIKLACARTQIAGMMALAEQKAADDQKKEELATLALYCVAVHLPGDHPAKVKYHDEAIKHYEAAKELGSDFAAPTF